MEPTFPIAAALDDDGRRLGDDEWERADRALYGPRYDDYTWDDDALYLTAHVEGGLAGYASLLFEGGVAELEELLVFEAFRRAGLGTELLRLALEAAAERGCHKGVLETHPSLPAVALYERRGFAVEATLPRHYAGLDHVLMSRFLEGRE
jgi:ribosomal protein S18 acetylase RimI-like enzyme